MSLHREHRNYLDRIRSQSAHVFDLAQVPKWLEKNTRDPSDPDRPWSFKAHEYQPEILSDLSDEVVVQKCSQVGASEMWVRLVIGMLALSKSMTLIYVLPTTGFARKFAKARIDPVIAMSPTVRDMVNYEVDSSELKQIGNSFLYIAGSYGQNSAISVPARGLFQDEVDFCNQTTLTTFNSRLGHSKPGEYYKRSFSTPTVNKFGINLMFEGSSQASYTVRCRSCRDWVAPNYMEDVEIPGYDGTIFTFEKDDLNNPRVEVDRAFIRCPSCRSEIPQADLCDPSLRKWVHRHPDRAKRGYQILPIDVPTINPPSRTIRQITEYERKKDWVNFKIGYPYDDAESSFLDDVIGNHLEKGGIPRPDDDYTGRLTSGTVFGLDVGKTSWFSVLMPGQSRDSKAIYFERIRQDGNNYLGQRVLFLIKVFGCVKGVVDAGPDISVSKFLVDNNPEGRVWACYYVRQQKGVLENYKLNESEGLLTASRTGTMDSMAKRINNARTTFCDGPEIATVRDHLSNLKRVESRTDDGELVANWITTGDDHYGHSLNYAHIAMDMLASGAGRVDASPSVPMMSRLPLRSEVAQEMHEPDPLGLRFATKPTDRRNAPTGVRILSSR